MILLDANLLVYAHVPSLPQNKAACRWLDEKLNGTAQVGFPWPSLLTFVRLVSNPRVFKRPETVQEAWARVVEWLDCETAWVPLPTDRHRQILGQLLRDEGGLPKLIMDAHLAALAIEHGLTLCSTDGDFARFRGLSWENPLAAQNR